MKTVTFASAPVPATVPADLASGATGLPAHIQSALANSRAGQATHENKMKKRIKLLLVDDHPVVRKGISSCLARHEHLQIVGEAGDGAEAMQKARELMPDIVLMDIDMPEKDGLEVTELLREGTSQGEGAHPLHAQQHGVCDAHHPIRSLRLHPEGGAHRGARARHRHREHRRSLFQSSRWPGWCSTNTSAAEPMIRGATDQSRARGSRPDCRRTEQQGNRQQTRRRCPHRGNPPRTHHAQAEHSQRRRPDQVRHLQGIDLA